MPPKVARGRKKATVKKVKKDKPLIHKNSNENAEIEILETDETNSNGLCDSNDKNVMNKDLSKEEKELVCNGNGESQINGMAEKETNPLAKKKKGGKKKADIVENTKQETETGDLISNNEDREQFSENCDFKITNNESSKLNTSKNGILEIIENKEETKPDTNVDLSGCKNKFESKKAPLKSGRPKKDVTKTSEKTDRQGQNEKKVQSTVKGEDVSPLPSDISELGDNEEINRKLEEIDEQHQAEDEIKADTETNISDDKKHPVNKGKPLKRGQQKGFTKAPEIKIEEKTLSKRGRKNANPLQSDNLLNLKQIEEPKSDEVPAEELMIPSKRGGRKKANQNKAAEIKKESPVSIEEPKYDEEVPAEELTISSKRGGRKKANQKEAVEVNKEDSPDLIDEPKYDEKVPTEELIISSKRGGRKNANRKEAVEVNKEDSADLIDEPKYDEKVPAEELIIPSKRGGRKKANQKESVKDLSKESNEVNKEPLQDMKKENKKSKELAFFGRKRKNEIAAEELQKNENNFIENKILKVTLHREEAIESIVEEQSKVTEKGGAKNVKAGDKRKKEDADCEESDVKSPKIPKSESKGQSKKDKMPDVTLLDFKNQSNSPSGKPWNLKISSWNVNGVRAWIEKDGLAYIKHENPDIMTFQETKCSDKMLPQEVNVSGYQSYWLAGDKDGYSGVGILSKKEPISVKYGIGVEEHDKEGRVITAEYETFYLVTAYVPNAGRKLVRLDYRMQWDKDFCSYLKNLDEKKPVILCGDLNVAHEEIDLANPKTNKRNAGFTKEEREGFSALLSEGFIDSFRHLYPEEKSAYTFWTYMMNARAKNVGWRLDYFVLSKQLTDHLCDSVIRKDVFGSDHCPITLFLCV